MENNSLIHSDVRLRVLRELHANSETCLAPLAERLNIQPLELVAVLSDRAVVETVHSHIRAACLLLLQSEAVPRLQKILREGKDAHAIRAASLLREMADERPQLNVHARISFDELHEKSSQANAGPLSRLTEIEGEAIDAEITEEEASGVNTST